MALPHHPQDTSNSAARIMMHGVTLAEIYVDGNDKVSPEKLVAWLQGLDTSGWTNLKMSCHTEPFEPYASLERNYITVRGDRMETDKEYEKRQHTIINNWQRQYEEYLREKHFFENTETGKARIAEIEAKKTRPINHPRI